jgi:hypothetical protein
MEQRISQGVSISMCTPKSIKTRTTSIDHLKNLEEYPFANRYSYTRCIMDYL